MTDGPRCSSFCAVCAAEYEHRRYRARIIAAHQDVVSSRSIPRTLSYPGDSEEARNAHVSAWEAERCREGWLHVCGGKPGSVTPAPKKDRLATGDAQGTVRIRDAKDLTLLGTFETEGEGQGEEGSESSHGELTCRRGVA